MQTTVPALLVYVPTERRCLAGAVAVALVVVCWELNVLEVTLMPVLPASSALTIFALASVGVTVIDKYARFSSDSITA